MGLTTTNQALLPQPTCMHRTVGALILREMATTYGRSPGGYLWAVAEPIAVIALLSFAFSLAFETPSLGVSFPLFYATGYLPYILFHDVASKTALSIRFSRPLLTFSAVTWFDLICARFLLNALTHIAVGSVVITALLVAFETQATPDIPVIAHAFCMAALLAFSFGSLNAFLFQRFPAWERLWTIATRPLFIISGVFFLYEDLPYDVREVLWFNPLLHITGEMRSGFYATYDTSYVSSTFVFAIAAGVSVLALMCLARHLDGTGQR